jgi:hypothetical protein
MRINVETRDETWTSLTDIKPAVRKETYLATGHQ